MKKISTLLVACLFAITSWGQVPFTITADNYPIFGTQNFDGANMANSNPLIPSSNGNWDMSAYHSGTTASIDYPIEMLQFFVSAGVDVYRTSVKGLTPALGYLIDSEFDFNDTGVFDKGLYVGAQSYSLAPFTGNTLDSLTFPLQGYLYPVGRQLMAFPATYQSKWQTESRREVDFNLTVMAAGLNKTPSKHVFTYFRTDTIIGWGKLRVYSNGAASVPYDVLIDRTIQSVVDSFFVGGAPAPPALLAAFGITQGQRLDDLYRYNAFREGNSTPLVIINYTDNNFSTPLDLYVDTDNLTTTSVGGPSQLDFATMVFPNPSNSGALNLQFAGNAPEHNFYEILNLEGRIVQSGLANLDAGLLQIQLNSQIPNGNYLLRMSGDKKQTAITEQFTLIR